MVRVNHNHTTVVVHPDNPKGTEYELAPCDVIAACNKRFEDDFVTVIDPDKPDTYRHAPENFWDGYTEVRRLPNGNLEFTAMWSNEIEEFDLIGHTVSRRPR